MGSEEGSRSSRSLRGLKPGLAVMKGVKASVKCAAVRAGAAARRKAWMVTPRRGARMREDMLGVVGADEFVGARGRFLCGGDDGAEDANDDEDGRGAEDVFEGGLA